MAVNQQGHANSFFAVLYFYSDVGDPIHAGKSLLVMARRLWLIADYRDNCRGMPGTKLPDMQVANPVAIALKFFPDFPCDFSIGDI